MPVVVFYPLSVSRLLMLCNQESEEARSCRMARRVPTVPPLPYGAM